MTLIIKSVPTLPDPMMAAFDRALIAALPCFRRSEQAAERYQVPAHEILQRVGEAGYVGGQEDMATSALTGGRPVRCGYVTPPDRHAARPGAMQVRPGRSAVARRAAPGRTPYCLVKTAWMVIAPFIAIMPSWLNVRP
jgi:hypothetical protein